MSTDGPNLRERLLDLDAEPSDWLAALWQVNAQKRWPATKRPPPDWPAPTPADLSDFLRQDLNAAQDDAGPGQHWDQAARLAVRHGPANPRAEVWGDVPPDRTWWEPATDGPELHAAFAHRTVIVTMVGVHLYWANAQDDSKPLSAHPLSPVLLAWSPPPVPVNVANVERAGPFVAVPYEIADLGRRSLRSFQEAKSDGIAHVLVDGQKLAAPETVPAHGAPVHDSGIIVPDKGWWHEYGQQLELEGLGERAVTRGGLVALVHVSGRVAKLSAQALNDMIRLTTLITAGPAQGIVADDDQIAAFLRRPESKPNYTREIKRGQAAVANMRRLEAYVRTRSRKGRLVPVFVYDWTGEDWGNFHALRPATWTHGRAGPWRELGRWTLSSALHFHRTAPVARIVAALEYWLGRSGGQHVADALRPAKGTTGPGNWLSLSRREFLYVVGEPLAFMAPDARRQQFKRHRDNLEAAQDAGELITVEVRTRPRKTANRYRGRIDVRASPVLVEAARMAAAGRFKAQPLADVLGAPSHGRSRLRTEPGTDYQGATPANLIRGRRAGP